MQVSNLGYPRMGRNRELKKLLEEYWQGKISESSLITGAQEIERQNWEKQVQAGVEWIPVGDFSFYDQMLDTAVMFGLIPDRFKIEDENLTDLKTYFAVARGNDHAPANAMKKWFDTNYHYIVPEWDKEPKLLKNYPLEAYKRAKKALNIDGKPVIIGPFTFVKLSKKVADFKKAMESLVPIYAQIFKDMENEGVKWVQVDEPALVLDISSEEMNEVKNVYEKITKGISLSIMLQTYFGSVSYYNDVISLPVSGIGLDFVQGLEDNLSYLEQYGFPKDKYLAAGVINGRNVWQTDLRKCLELIKKIESYVASDRMWIQPSCSLLHLPVTTADETHLPEVLKRTLKFADERLMELNILGRAVKDAAQVEDELKESDETLKAYREMTGQTDEKVRKRIAELKEEDFKREVPFVERKRIQSEKLKLPLLPATTIGSFPQTPDVRRMRADFKKGKITQDEYRKFIRDKIAECIKLQEDIGLDVLVHGEFERNDMVEYFGEKLKGFVVTKNGWVQSYGSRCVKPPILYGDVWRDEPMTIEEITHAQSLTQKPVKGMLTGPVTIINWSFVRDDIGRDEVAYQIGLALRDEIQELEEKGIDIIQVDDPALREGLPLKSKDRDNYLNWAVRAFKLATSGVKPETQIHTHMCYGEFKDIIQAIDDMDADVISIEASRAGGDVIDHFAKQKYSRDIGLGVYDIHSPRIPKMEEMEAVIRKALKYFDKSLLWVNPDCGLKTRKPGEVDAALRKMVEMALKLRQELS
ncbi:MAG: 5-methyltetrahydropteroyltriglutamate--homocysteine S-methyltransferase [Desulfotomaculum sp.]|nr:5-methyltetrahydropteroyltriglutamate--homocysteine S-methyltransferase [Desulfotomaculum sp.]